MAYSGKLRTRTQMRGFPPGDPLYTERERQVQERLAANLESPYGITRTWPPSTKSKARMPSHYTSKRC